MANKVVIDGVIYVPVTEVKNMDLVLMALALQYHTPDTLEEYGFDSLAIDVNEDNEGESFQEFGARLAELMRDQHDK